jgi:hypothetical protein
VSNKSCNSLTFHCHVRLLSAYFLLRFWARLFSPTPGTLSKYIFIYAYLLIYFLAERYLMVPTSKRAPLEMLPLAVFVDVARMIKKTCGRAGASKSSSKDVALTAKTYRDYPPANRNRNYRLTPRVLRDESFPYRYESTHVKWNNCYKSGSKYFLIGRISGNRIPAKID